MWRRYVASVTTEGCDDCHRNPAPNEGLVPSELKQFTTMFDRANVPASE